MHGFFSLVHHRVRATETNASQVQVSSWRSSCPSALHAQSVAAANVTAGSLVVSPALLFLVLMHAALKAAANIEHALACGWVSATEGALLTSCVPLFLQSLACMQEPEAGNVGFVPRRGDGRRKGRGRRQGVAQQAHAPAVAAAAAAAPLAAPIQASEAVQQMARELLSVLQNVRPADAAAAAPAQPAPKPALGVTQVLQMLARHVEPQDAGPQQEVR
jgi:hypothetical protein